MFKLGSLFGRKPVPLVPDDAAVTARALAIAQAGAPAAADTSVDRAHGRDAPRPQVLSRHAMAWSAQLPPPVRPVQLLALYPRLANVLALCWADPALTTAQFDALLIDARGGRQGFPPLVAAELLCLREHHDEHRANTPRHDPAQPWARHSQATSDR